MHINIHEILVGATSNGFQWSTFLTSIFGVVVGGLITFVFAGAILSDFYRGVILAITLGMLIYIVLFELLPHMIENKNKKSVILGMLIGMTLLILSTLFE